MQKSVFTLMLLFVSLNAHAFDWSAVGSQCTDMNIPGLGKFVSDATAWEAFQLKTQAEIDTLTNHTCPKYLQSANGAQAMSGNDSQKITLEQYLAEHSNTFNDAGDSTGRARHGDSYLETNFNHIDALHSAIGYNFPGSGCGQTITSGRKHYAAIIAKIHQMSELAGKQCAQLAEKISATGPDPAKLQALKAGGAQGSKFKAPVSSSTITGELDEAELKGTNGRTEADKIHIQSEQNEKSVAGFKDPNVGLPSIKAMEIEGGTESSPMPSSLTGGSSEISAGAQRGSRNLASVAFAEKNAERSFEGDNWSFSAKLAVPGTAGFGKGTSSQSDSAAALGASASPNSEPVPAQNEDKSRFFQDLSLKQSDSALKTSSAEPTIFEVVSHRYRLLSARLK